MKHYLLSVCYPAESSQPPPDELKRIMSDVVAVRKEMQAAGVWLFSGGLHPPSSAILLRHQDSEIVITDGPFIESNILLAEEAVQEAYATALARWSKAGIPPSPAGWIIATARNKALDRLRTAY
jgi:hypothetical protein